MLSGKLLLCLPVSLVGLASFCTAASSNCDDVYKHATRNVTFAEHDWASLNTVYDSHCQRDGRVRKFRWDSSLGVTYEKIPINMTGNAKAEEDKIRNFCKFYSSLRYEEARSRVGTSTVVVEALANYNACKEIESEAGVTISHQFAEPHSVVVNFNFRGSTRVMAVQGVVTSPNLSCVSNRAKTAGKGDTLNAKSRFEERANFTILCTRSGRKNAKGATDFEPASLAIATNVASYTISMPADSVYGNQLASDATARIDQLTATVKELSQKEQELEALKKKIGSLKVEAKLFVISSVNPGAAGQHFATGTNHEVAAKVVLVMPRHTLSGCCDLGVSSSVVSRDFNTVTAYSLPCSCVC